MFTRQRALALTCAGCVMALLVGRRPISDADLFWQLRLGQLIRAGGGPGARDPFTFTHGGEPFPPVCWLAQVVYAALFDLGHSFRLLQIADNLLFVAALLVAGLSVRPREARPAALAGGLALGFLAALPHNSLRPQTFALLGFALLFALRASGRPAWVKVLGGGVILVAWQNLHPSVLVAGVVLACFLAADAWAWWRGRKPDQPATTAALLVLVGLCQFATPLGLGILSVSSRNAWLAVHLPEPCPEWLPCWDPRTRPVALPSFWVPLAVTLLLLARVRFRVPAADLILIGVMSCLTASAVRFGFFMAVALVPAWARLLERALPAEEARPGTRPARALVAAAVLAVVLAAALSVLSRPQLFAPNLPPTGVEPLRAVLPAGRLYNCNVYGGALAWEGGGRWQVLMDGRIYAFSDAEWNDYFEAAAGRVPVDVLVARHAPDAFVLDAVIQRGLIRRLREDAKWQEIHGDEYCSVFVPRFSGGSETRAGLRPAAKPNS
jgi:hypothetical protein